MTSKKPSHKDIDTSISHGYNITVKPTSWMLPNRFGFGPWIDKTFKYHKQGKTQTCSECAEGEACPIKKISVSSVSLFPQQDFIKDYMQFDSPYRGLLVYHGLGSGKTCSSIVAAEILMNHVDVVVMLPASLRDNFINEIHKCGCAFYNKNQHWVFVNPEKDSSIRKKLQLTKEFVKKQKGIWIPLQDAPANYINMTEMQKKQINDQMMHMIDQRYNFINYNGLRETTVRKMVEDGTNPFDDKTVIIDEIHNLISRIVNGRKIGFALYKLLMAAKNCKLILLSGTPIINYPHEVAYIMNLIAGPQISYELKANKGSAFDKDTIETVLNNNKYVDDFLVDMSNRRIVLSFIPNGFEYVNKKSMKITRSSIDKEGEVLSNDAILENIIKEMRVNLKIDISKRITTKEYRLFPEKKEDFDELFVNETRGEIKNERLFMKRAVGLISYYNAVNSDLFPDWEIKEVPLPMTDLQFAVYEKARAQERKQESSSSKAGKSSKGGESSSSSQVYRFFSRAICNFVFPEKIKRPFPSKMSDMRKELDEDVLFEDISKDKSSDSIDTLTKRGKVLQYHHELDNCLAEIEYSGDEYLAIDKVGRYSPKIERIVREITACKGSALVYSQFRKVEGLGLLGMCLKANGWAEFRVDNVDGEWVIDMTEEELRKPTYAAFTGNNEESRILLKIFNNDLGSIPESISSVLKGRDNLHGNIIKVMMITQSGAEGISLKNTRQVHIMEPYWNHIRMDQVIGRAIRTCSHVALDKEERNVKVFIYYSIFSKEQKDSSFTIRTKDKSVTSDEYLFNIAKHKKGITDGLLELMKRASVDCVLNAKHHNNLTCFSFPVNINDAHLSKFMDISSEELDVSYKKNVEKNQWEGELLQTKKGNFVVKKGTNEVYDYDIYLETGKIIKLGIIEQDGTTRRIRLIY